MAYIKITLWHANLQSEMVLVSVFVLINPRIAR